MSKRTDVDASDDELRPEYDFTAADFRKAVRGKYATRSTEAKRISASTPERITPERRP